ncbi:hypothetical protein L798_09081 [Zootermopsis nevadensis]|uniref:Uncharacterized protein n=1 Tax=Zootermopsis nevadensis TaxID=136037 RepID=A0A067R3Q6_ZOONE|nr:hypothetical protein L798_09081 [Zootermopsis nevadensis]
MLTRDASLGIDMIVEEVVSRDAIVTARRFHVTTDCCSLTLHRNCCCCILNDDRCSLQLPRRHHYTRQHHLLLLIHQVKGHLLVASSKPCRHMQFVACLIQPIARTKSKNTVSTEETPSLLSYY